MMKRLLLVFLLLCWSLPASSAAPQTVRELIVLGLEKNIGLQVEQLNVPVSAEEIQVAAAAFAPELFASAGYSQAETPQTSTLMTSDPFASEEYSGQIGLRKRYQTGLAASFSLSTNRVTENNISDRLDPRYRSAVLLDLTQPLLRNFGQEANRTKLQLAQNKNRQIHYQYFFQAQNLALQIESLALQLAGEGEVVRLRIDAVRLAKELYQANRRRFDAGVIPVSEVQEAETDLANRELNLSLAQRAYELSLERLNRLLDYQLSDNFSAAQIYRSVAVDEHLVEPDLPEFDQLFSAAKQRRVDLEIGRIEIENSSLQKSFYTNQQRPQLDLKMLAGINGLSGDERAGISNYRYAGDWGDSFASMSAADGYQWGAGIEFSLPLGNQAAKSRVKQAALLERQANYRKQDLEASLKQELLQQQTVLRRTAEQVAIANRFRRLAEKSVAQEQRRMEEGLSDTFRVILFQNNMINANIDRIVALTQYHQAVAQMNYARGIILEQNNISLQQGSLGVVQ